MRHGVVAARQLNRLGLSSSTIARWVADGRLVRLHRGVHAVGHAALTPDGHRMAAVLAAGPEAVLSHRSAAEMWGLLTWTGTYHEVTVAGRGSRARRRGIRVHRCRLEPEDRTVVRGIPVTTVPRLARAIGRRGVRPLLALIERHGLPTPSANLFLHGHDRDLVWPDRHLVVELDTTAFHATTAAFERDRRRDADLQALGYRVLRFTDRRIADDAPAVARTIAAALGRGSPFAAQGRKR
jgi:hypothetical protein